MSVHRRERGFIRVDIFARKRRRIRAIRCLGHVIAEIRPLLIRWPLDVKLSTFL
jgi:hypothetical protein